MGTSDSTAPWSTVNVQWFQQQHILMGCRSTELELKRFDQHGILKEAQAEIPTSFPTIQAFDFLHGEDFQEKIKIV